jgi:hypothetical protein
MVSEIHTNSMGIGTKESLAMAKAGFRGVAMTQQPFV